ncbi:NrsF family protein [Paracoccus sp. (in: a-proteobacteria)]|uniref:NrsF family protein n=1 Tax=Paracoccus sp. TaxID=267 RepID=UPI003A8511A1
MKTDRLIDLLSCDPVAPRPVAPRLLALAAPVLLVSGGIAIWMLGVRADLAQALSHRVTAMKWLLPLAVAVPSLIAVLRMIRPQVQRVPAVRIVAATGCVALIWLILSAITLAPDRLWPVLRGNSALICLSSVIGIAAPVLAAALMVLQEGASLHPARSGGLAGLATGGFAAAIYALHCNQDQPLFFLTWYSLGILTVGGIGALAGRRMLRW